MKRGLALQGASVFDVYPTVLYLLGLPVPQDAAGKVLVDALDPGFVRAASRADGADLHGPRPAAGPARERSATGR